MALNFSAFNKKDTTKKSHLDTGSAMLGTGGVSGLLMRQALKKLPERKPLSFSVAPEQKPLTSFPTRTAQSTPQIDTEVKPHFMQELGTAVVRDIGMRWPLSAYEAYDRMGKAMTGQKGALTEVREPKDSILGPISSIQSDYNRRKDAGEDHAMLKAFGSTFFDTPVGVVEKGIFLGLGVVFRGLKKTGPDAVEQFINAVAKSQDPEDIASYIRRAVPEMPIEEAQTVAKGLVRVSNPEDVRTILKQSDERIQALVRTQADTVTPTVPARAALPTRQMDGVVPARQALPNRPQTTNTVPSRFADDVAGNAEAPSVLSFFHPEQGKVFVRINNRELDNLIDEAKNIPEAAMGRAQVHLDAFTDAMKGAGREVSREEFAKLAPETMKALKQAVEGTVVTEGLFYKLGEMPVRVQRVAGDNTTFMYKKGDEFVTETMPTKDFYNQSTRIRNQEELANVIQGKQTTPTQSTPTQRTLPENVPARSKEGLVKLTGELLTPISSRLGRIAPILKRQLRRFEAKVALQTMRDTKAVQGFLQATKKMSKEDGLAWDLARKNGDEKAVNALARKYGVEAELAKTRKVLDDMYTRAKDAGMDIQRRANYFPRIVKNPIEYMRYLRGQPDWGDMQFAIEEYAKKKGIKYTDVTQEEMSAIVNLHIRGYGDSVSLSAPGFSKGRSVQDVTEELNMFYENSDTALATYVIRMNDEIAARQFFGKGENIRESIGAFTMKLMQEGKLNPVDDLQVKEILQSRFHRGKMNGAIEVYRNVEYISTMGSVISAITQLGDLAFSAYSNGLYHTAKGMGKTILRKGVTKEDLGIENIVQEFMSNTRSGKLLDTTFKYVGLSALDRLGKETLVNGFYSKMHSLAKNAGTNEKAYQKAYNELAKYLEPDEIPQAIADFANKNMSETTEVALFNKLLDFQPVAKSEMPQRYLEMPNGRLFYMLKSFTLKQIDVFRREAIDDIVSGNPKKMAKGVKNMVHLGGMFMLANMGADTMKDFILGRDTPPEDTVIDNLWRLAGASKFDVYKARTDGVGQTVIRKILFPTSVFDGVGRDVANSITGREYERGPLQGERFKSETVSSIPVAGKLYYWWFGRGRQKEQYNASRSPADLDLDLDLDLDIDDTEVDIGNINIEI